MWTQYPKIRSKIKTGDVFFTASPALFSRLIRWFTKSKVSHCGMFLEIGDRIFTVEAMEGQGVVMSLASVRLDGIEIVVSRPNNVPHDIITRALQDVNKKEYDLFGAVMAPFFDTKSNQAFCSEWVAHLLNLDFSHFRNGIVPKDVLTALQNRLKI